MYNVENEAVMNVLSRYFEMSRPDAERAIKIYRTFCAQTELVVQYLSVARRYEHATRLEIPKLKHAPITLAASLQEYLDDKDFEINRRQYLAEQEYKKTGTKPTFAATDFKPRPSTSQGASTPTSSAPAARPATSHQAKAPADLIDFFETIETQQQASETNPFLRQQQQQQIPQPTGYQFAPQQTGYQAAVQQNFNSQMPGFDANSAFAPAQEQSFQAQPLQNQYTGAGFGGYGPQPTQQQTFPSADPFIQQPQSYVNQAPAQQPSQLQPQSTNPFRQSMMATGGAFSPPVPTQIQPSERQGSNPFARSNLPPAIPEDSVPQQQQQQQQTYQAQALLPQQTGTNPFARAAPPPTSQSPPSMLTVQPTGSTNPFRQSAFVNQQTGTGWQNAPQATMGGLEGLQTIPVFPRPGQGVQQQQQQQQQSPWI
jgi:hypothetical protein